MNNVDKKILEVLDEIIFFRSVFNFILAEK